MENLLSLVENDTVILGLEPFHGIVLGESVGESQAAGLVLLVAHVHAGTAEDDIEVHTINTDGRVVLDTQVNVFLDTETKIAALSLLNVVFAPRLMLFTKGGHIFFIAMI